MDAEKPASPHRSPHGLKPVRRVLPVCTSGHRAFSLLELLSVIAIVAILMALLMPAIASMSGSAGRRGAVNIVMNTIDQARVAALEQGREVHVVFARRNAPEPDAILVVRESADSYPPPSPSAPPLEKLTRWIPLPKGVVFLESGVLKIDPSTKVSLASLQALGATGNIKNFGVLTFGPSGTVQFPVGQSPNSRRVFISEIPRSDAEKDYETGFDVISVARYTGRPQLDVTFDNPNRL